jgi:hypothetical protein
MRFRFTVTAERDIEEIGDYIARVIHGARNWSRGLD